MIDTASRLMFMVHAESTVTSVKGFENATDGPDAPPDQDAIEYGDSISL